MTTSAKSDRINIVGAGVFGLSTAIHLADRGYTNVVVFDRNDYEKTLYSYTKGCDAASADINKIIRSAYGSQTLYQNLAFDAIKAWDEWNDELRNDPAAAPPGMSSKDVLWINNGDLSVTDDDVLGDFEKATIQNMERLGYQNTQLANNIPAHLELAARKGFASRLQPFQKNLLGVMDTTGGVVLADKACRFALHKAKRLGVQFVLSREAGKVIRLLERADNTVIGLETADGKAHYASMTIMAGGAWTPTLVPSLDRIAEATAGSVLMFRLPENSPLRERFSPQNFPAWSFRIGDGADHGLYGFPVDEHGILKLGYRGSKFTNPRTQADGIERSVPVTRWTETEQIREIPLQAMRVIQKFIDEYLPELSCLPVWATRLCWYTDSFDNQYVIDRVPTKPGLFVATAGSGHAFKFLPTIGSWVADIVEGVGLDREAVRSWRWRSLPEGGRATNSLMEGSQGPRALKNIALWDAEQLRANL
ncbi:hypothetical protein NU219Hw_g2866t1 [Hortaea werneckii]